MGGGKLLMMVWLTGLRIYRETRTNENNTTEDSLKKNVAEVILDTAGQRDKGLYCESKE